VDLTISATELARRLGDVLGRIRYRGDSFVVERNGEPVARITPLAGNNAGSVLEGLQAWCEAAPHDAALADDLDRVNRSDRAPTNPWDSSLTPAR
jgi:antitoxin (DNA-binding transcriptional repressor) of toxin-antitoxin stability system